MDVYKRFLESSVVPWRIRHPISQWVEESAYMRYPRFYRWLHFGRSSDPVKAVTKGPLHHFFGYYDKSPWNASGRYLLGHEVRFNDRAPGAEDVIGIGVIDLNAGNQFKRLTECRAWNWQQGSMAQWHPLDPERLFVHNDCRHSRFVGVVRDLEKGEEAVFDRPLYALLPDGKTGFSLNFARLAVHRPGYGYAGVNDPYGDDPHPDVDGIWRVDLTSGHADQLVSLADLAARNPKYTMEGSWHYINHIQPSRGGDRIAFFHVWHKDAQDWEVRLYTCRPDGSELACLLDTGFISHYDWRDDDTILVWANRSSEPARFLLLSHSRPDFKVFGEADLRADGHCSFSPNGRWVLNDMYPDAHDMRTLMLVGAEDERRWDIARLYSPKSRWWGEIRCDLHPRWSRDGRQICIDSVHEGSRQMYVVDVPEFAL